VPIPPDDSALERRARALFDRLDKGEITMPEVLSGMMHLFLEHKGLAETGGGAAKAKPAFEALPDVDWETLLSCPPSERPPEPEEEPGF